MFKDELERLRARIPGATGVLIVGIDGIPVQKSVESQRWNLENFSAEYLSFLKKTAATNQELGLGQVQEMTLVTERHIAIIRLITEEYFVVCALGRDGLLGKARHELAMSVSRLAKELS